MWKHCINTVHVSVCMVDVLTVTKIPSDALRQAFIDYGRSMGVWLETVPRETPPSEVTHTHHSCTMFYVPFSKPFIASIPGRLKYGLLVINTWFCYTHIHTHTSPPTPHAHTHTHTLILIYFD